MYTILIEYDYNILITYINYKNKNILFYIFILFYNSIFLAKIFNNNVIIT